MYTGQEDMQLHLMTSILTPTTILNPYDSLPQLRTLPLRDGPYHLYDYKFIYNHTVETIEIDKIIK